MLDRNKELSRYNQKILIEAQRRGISLVLATGRNIFTLDSLADQLKMAEFKNGYLIESMACSCTISNMKPMTKKKSSMKHK